MCEKKLSVLGPAHATPLHVIKFMRRGLTHRLRQPEVLDKEG
jgi:hypothetical protein